MKLAKIEAKLHRVLPLDPGQVLIDLEIVGKLRIRPGVNNGVDATPGLENKVGETSRRERPQLLGIQSHFLHEGWPIERKGPATLPAADASAQLIDQVWSNGIVVREHDLIVMFEIGFRGKRQTRRVDLPFVLVAPAAENTLLRVNRMVDANIELIGKRRIGNVYGVVVERKIVHAPLVWQRIKLENQCCSRIEATRWDHVARKGRSVEIMDSNTGKTREISISHGLAGHSIWLNGLSPIPHGFVIAKEKRVLAP